MQLLAKPEAGLARQHAIARATHPDGPCVVIVEAKKFGTLRAGMHFPLSVSKNLRNL